MLTPGPSRRFAERDATGVVPGPPEPQSETPRRPRQGSTLLGAVLAVMIGWGVSGLGSAPPPGLLLRTADGITVLEADGAPVLSAPGGQVSPDGDVVVHAENLARSRTRVVASDAATGATRWSSEVHGRYAVRLVAEGGGAAVLGAPRVDGVSPYVPQGRSRTRMAVVTRSGAREYELDGNFEPEAMSLDASSVFVIQYTPAEAPTSYQVRRLDLASGEIVDVFTPDEELQQEMGGTARTQVGSADGRRLYTLYTLTSDDGAHSHAFIHVLDLEEQWAHCIDLPEEFSGEGGSTAVALTPDGARLFVADRAGGAVTAIDTTSLEAVRTSVLVMGQEGEQVVATTTESHDLLVSDGARIDLLDATTLERVRSFAMSSPVVAVQSQGDGRFAVAMAEEIVWLELKDGTTVDSKSLAGQPAITGLGAAPGHVPDPRQGIDCAC